LQSITRRQGVAIAT